MSSAAPTTTASEPVRRNPTQAELDATPVLPASEVTTMNEVRAAIDDLDRKIVGLLGRFRLSCSIPISRYLYSWESSPHAQTSHTPETRSRAMERRKRIRG